MIWIAIVANIHEGNQGLSKRPQGDWAAFVAPDRTQAIQRAMKAKREWKGTATAYTVYVGTLVEAETASGWEEAEWPEKGWEQPPPPVADEDIPF